MNEKKKCLVNLSVSTEKMIEYSVIFTKRPHQLSFCFKIIFSNSSKWHLNYWMLFKRPWKVVLIFKKHMYFFSLFVMYIGVWFWKCNRTIKNGLFLCSCPIKHIRQKLTCKVSLYKENSELTESQRFDHPQTQALSFYGLGWTFDIMILLHMQSKSRT